MLNKSNQRKEKKRIFFLLFMRMALKLSLSFLLQIYNKSKCFCFVVVKKRCIHYQNEFIGHSYQQHFFFLQNLFIQYLNIHVYGMLLKFLSKLASRLFRFIFAAHRR